MHNTPHNRKTDVDQEYQHHRASDAILLELLSSVKHIGGKQDELASAVGEVRQSNEAIRDRISRVEKTQEEMACQIKETKTYVEGHAKEEEKILGVHVKKMVDFQTELEKIQRGFPKNEDGERDPRSHADEHEIDAAKKKDMSTLMKDIRKWVLISFLAAIGSGVLYLLVTGTKIEISRVVSEGQAKKPGS